jgi:4-amino-4-deoxy-L-arabinose transferase-like glycosyltransferase
MLRKLDRLMSRISKMRGKLFSKLFKSKYFIHLLIILLICVGLIRISSTYEVFWQTYDEPYYIARGMEWLDREHYSKKKDYLHNEATPLPGIMTALGPYYKGLRATGLTERHKEGNNILHSDGNYEMNLTLARIGILPFFIIATLIVSLWAKWLFGEFSALFSVFFFTTLPAVLAHSGLATSDMAAGATLATALFTLCLWLEEPTLPRTYLLGIFVGLSCLAKYSNLAYLSVSGTLIVALYWLGEIKSKNKNICIKRWIGRSGIILLICSLIIWAGYRFSVSFLTSPDTRPHLSIDRIFGTDGFLHEIAYLIVEGFPIPAPDFFSGLRDIAQHNSEGHWAYLLGEAYMHGRWYFFPIAITVKTTLPFLVLSILGIFLSLRQFIKQQGEIKLLVPTVGALGILIVAMLSSLNLGIRHVLSMFPLLAVLAGYGALILWRLNQPKFLGSVLLIGLVVWQIISSATAQPNYLAYYNELAGKNPDEIVMDTTDWGQDLKSLAKALENRKINNFSLSYAGSADLERLGLPPHTKLIPYQKTTGWVAISLLNMKFGTWEPPYDQFSWLEKYEPVEVIGKTIRLYYIPK